jgi:SAM-dependent methyltransferase
LYKPFFLRIFYRLSYFGKPVWDTGISPPELLHFIEQNPPGRALDLGCGTGTNVITLAQNGWQVTGVDFVPRAIRQARRKIQQAGVQAEVIVDDVTSLKTVSGPFDLILDMGCFHSLSKTDKSAYTQNIQRLLAPAGTFLLYAWLHTVDSNLSGLNDQDLAAFTTQLNLVKREDGSERGMCPSAWLTFQREAHPLQSENN